MNASSPILTTETPDACPAWCAGGHGVRDDFHRSEPTGQWVADHDTYADDDHTVRVWLEIHIDEAGALGRPIVALEGRLSDCEDFAEFTVPDAVKLIRAVTAAVALAGAEVDL